MRKKIVIDEDNIGINPFRINLRIPVNRVTNARQYTQDVDGVMHPTEYMFDKREHIKLYRFPGLRKTICSLSSPAHLLLLYICMKLESNNEYIVIDRASYMSDSGIKSVNTYKAGVKELEKYAFIRDIKDIADAFWINPAYFFNGNAVAKYPDNLEVKGEFTKH